VARIDDLRVIAERGYVGAASTDLDQQTQAVSLFITDKLAASIGQDNGVTTIATPLSNSVTVSPPLQRCFSIVRNRRRSSSAGQVHGQVVSTRQPLELNSGDCFGGRASSVETVGCCAR
jgi:hypothetical protein